jgi:hypothetical protein
MYLFVEGRSILFADFEHFNRLVCSELREDAPVFALDKDPEVRLNT